jgi:tetratricopeptide (TPR) repeat protein
MHAAMATNKQWANAEWFRNTEWNPEIEAKFFKKLHRARDKAQYLKLQACYLADSHPNVALALLDKFFALGEDFFLADAHLTSANAYLALGQTGEAISSFRKALEAERQRPGYRTTAWSEYVLLVADRGIKSEVDEALRVLNENRTDLIFPKLVFVWHGASALIHAERGDRAAAKEHAIKALDAAKMSRSGFGRHPNVGLVGSEFNGVRKKLEKLTRKERWGIALPWG